jgi:hypothetical protein
MTTSMPDTAQEWATYRFGLAQRVAHRDYLIALVGALTLPFAYMSRDQPADAAVFVAVFVVACAGIVAWRSPRVIVTSAGVAVRGTFTSRFHEWRDIAGFGNRQRYTAPVAGRRSRGPMGEIHLHTSDGRRWRLPAAEPASMVSMTPSDVRVVELAGHWQRAQLSTDTRFVAQPAVTGPAAQGTSGLGDVPTSEPSPGAAVGRGGDHRPSHGFGHQAPSSSTTNAGATGTASGPRPSRRAIPLDRLTWLSVVFVAVGAYLAVGNLAAYLNGATYSPVALAVGALFVVRGIRRGLIASASLRFASNGSGRALTGGRLVAAYVGILTCAVLYFASAVA